MITTPDHWWRSVDPLGHAASRLANQPVFVLPHLTDEGRRDPASEYWQQIARAPVRVADSIFAEVLMAGAPAGRLYALAWLATTEPIQFLEAEQTFRTSVDSAWVQLSCSDARLQPLALREAVSVIDWRARAAILASDSTCGMSDGFIR
jgi:hypothetical protein